MTTNSDDPKQEPLDARVATDQVADLQVDDNHELARRIGVATQEAR